MSAIRLESKNPEQLCALADHILETWKNYTDEDSFIDLVLRNNITTDEHPLGVFHPHANLHHVIQT